MMVVVFVGVSVFTGPFGAQMTFATTLNLAFRVSIIRSKAADIKVVTLPPFTEFKRRMGK